MMQRVTVRKTLFFFLSGIAAWWLVSCHSSPQNKATGPEFKIVGGSENSVLVPLLEDFGRAHRVNVTFQESGSVDLMLALQQPATQIPEDAVWPADSLWLEMAGNRDVKMAQSITRTPIVLGVKVSKAKELGIYGKDLGLSEIIKLLQTHKLRFIMTNPTQSNSGCMAYLGFLHRIIGRDDPFSTSDLRDPKVLAGIRPVLQSMDRTSGSSGWLMKLYESHPERYDAVINYEATLLDANARLEKSGQEPLYIFYLKDGQTLADSPLAYVDHGDPAKAALFKQLQDYLLTPEVQQKMGELGRRTGLLASSAPAGDLFSPDHQQRWGVQPNRVLQPIPLPSAETIRAALQAYQLLFKKPSLTVYILDYSGSMEGPGNEGLMRAMQTLLDPAIAEKYFLQTGPADISIAIPFDARVRGVLTAHGNKPDELAALVARLQEQKPGGGTDFYTAGKVACDTIRSIPHYQDYQVSVILMTDGQSQGTMEPFLQAWGTVPDHIPVFSILFGDADRDQVDRVAKETGGTVFDGSRELETAFRKAKGYN